MKKNIHPDYNTVKISCSCGATFSISSTIKKDAMNIEVCSSCHPFYSGKQKIIDTAGRVDKFKQKYANFSLKR